MTDIYGYVHGLKTKNVVAIYIITLTKMIISMLFLLIFCIIFMIIFMNYFNTENIRTPIDDTISITGRWKLNFKKTMIYR